MSLGMWDHLPFRRSSQVLQVFISVSVSVTMVTESSSTFPRACTAIFQQVNHDVKVKVTRIPTTISKPAITHNPLIPFVIFSENVACTKCHTIIVHSYRT